MLIGLVRPLKGAPAAGAPASGVAVRVAIAIAVAIAVPVAIPIAGFLQVSITRAGFLVPVAITDLVVVGGDLAWARSLPVARPSPP